MKPLEKLPQRIVRSQHAHLIPLRIEPLVKIYQGADPGGVYVYGPGHIHYDIARFFCQFLKRWLCIHSKGVIEPARDFDVGCHRFSAYRELFLGGAPTGAPGEIHIRSRL